jgi:HEAT repeat protein
LVFGPYEIESLIFGLTLPSWQTRAESAWELGRYDDDRAVDALLDLLAQPGENTAVLMEGVASLDRIRSQRARGGLRDFAARTSVGTLMEERCSEAALRAVERLDALGQPYS